MTDKAEIEDKKWIGAYVSAAGGIEMAPLRAEQIGANAFALFACNAHQ